MTKKNRAKSKAKRFGEGSAKPIVDASTYGVGNAFAGIAGPSPIIPPRGTKAGMKELLVVDGYNVIHATPKYERLIYDRSDEAVIVFDAAGNVSPDRPDLPRAGIQIKFSPTGVTADTVIQDLCTKAREEGRACSVVSSDAMIQATVMGHGVARISSRMLVEEIDQMHHDFERSREEQVDIKLTLGGRLSPAALARLRSMRGI